ncbi:MAG: hypothetical protein D6715_10300 [Calditrichaeota bacterium]|nr:MAG: hypothetical protein D6715_10300 [Calditrichota bacterium]
MAYKPSRRRHLGFQEIPLDIRPVMNLMVVLIPILLYSAEFVKLSIRELNLPPASGKGTGQAEEKPKETARRFQLTIFIQKNGFMIGNQAGYLREEGEDLSQPTIPLKDDGSYDYEALQKKLIEIKQKIQGKGFVDEKSAIISAEADIAYKHIIKVMDYISTYRDEDGTVKELFPQINIGSVLT